MQETANKQKRITLKTLHEMLNGMSVELAEKVHLLFMAKFIDNSDYDFRNVDQLFPISPLLKRREKLNIEGTDHFKELSITCEACASLR